MAAASPWTSSDHGRAFRQHRQIGFVDWHRTLCADSFWCETLRCAEDPLHGDVLIAQRHMFAHVDRVRDWMRGDLSSAQMVAAVPDVDHAAVLDALRRQISVMRAHPGLVGELRRLHSDVRRVLATDNMDCFEADAWSIPTLADAVDELRCSCTVGALKAENPERFFGEVLDRVNVPVSEAVLIDDDPAALSAFAALGGEVIRCRAPQDAARELADWARRTHRPAAA